MLLDPKTVRKISLASLIVSVPSFAQEIEKEPKLNKQNISIAQDAIEIVSHLSDFLKDFDLITLGATMSEETGDD